MGLEPITDALQEHCSAKLSYVGRMIVFAASRLVMFVWLCPQACQFMHYFQVLPDKYSSIVPFVNMD